MSRHHCVGLGIAAFAAIVGLIGPATASAQTAAAPTFTKDIAPIFRAKCEACHRADGMAPMSLSTYEEARPWARSIRDRVATRQMPPWHIDKTVGIQQFKNDRSLSDAQIDTVVQWVAAGAPKGDMKDMPAAAVWPDETKSWHARDEVRRTRPRREVARLHDAGGRAGRVVPAGVADQPHRAALGARHRDSSVVGEGPQDHASRARRSCARTKPSTRSSPAPRPPCRAMACSWSGPSASTATRCVPNSGRLMLPGSSITWEMHYHAVGEEITSHTELAVWFYPKGQEPKHREVLGLFNTFSAPPGVERRQRAAARHSAQLGRHDRELRHAAPERPHRELPGAHAPARQGHVDGSDVSGRPPRDIEPGRRLQLQLAQHVHLRR